MINWLEALERQQSDDRQRSIYGFIAIFCFSLVVILFSIGLLEVFGAIK